VADPGWQPEKDGERATYYVKRQMGGYGVYIAKFGDHWWWNRPNESHHPEPGRRWFGPHSKMQEAEAEAQEWQRKRWRGF